MANFTQDAILKTFGDLLEALPFEKITVSTLIRECNISRNTFYYHYEDIPSLLQDVLQQEFSRIYAQTDGKGNWRDRVLLLLNTIGAHRKVYDRIYHSSYQEALRSDIQRIALRFSLTAVQDAGGHALSESLQQTIAAFFSSAILGVCSLWLDSGADEPAQALISRMAVFDGLLEQAVARAMELDK